MINKSIEEYIEYLKDREVKYLEQLDLESKKEYEPPVSYSQYCEHCEEEHSILLNCDYDQVAQNYDY